MQNYFKRWLMVLCGAVLSVSALFAQTSLVITPQGAGDPVSINLDEIRTLTFSENGVVVNKADGSTYSAAFADLSKLAFYDAQTAIRPIFSDNETNGAIALSRNGQNLTLSGLHTTAPTQAVIYDALGRQVGRIAVSEGQAFSVAALPKGVYLLKLNQTTFKFTR